MDVIILWLWFHDASVKIHTDIWEMCFVIATEMFSLAPCNYCTVDAIMCPNVCWNSTKD